MTAQSETTTANHNADLHPGASSTRVRDARDPATLAGRWGERARSRPRNERDRGKRPGATPWHEDHPSPRCVLEDTAEGARHFGGEGAGLVVLYWAVAALPLAVNMAASCLHIASVRPARCWGTALAIVLFIAAMHVFA